MPDDLDALAERERALAAAGTRRLLGIAGPPGSGKSTLAQALAERLGGAAVVVPMDGFHMPQAELVRLGRRDRMGAPDTFDVAGYAALLRRLRAREEPVVRAPGFDRDVEEPVPDVIAVPREVPLVISEGNYLLLEDEPWASVRGLLDEVWYAEIDDATRLRLLIDRHVRHGKTPEAARAWVARSDEANAARVVATRARADRVVGIVLDT